MFGPRSFFRGFFVFVSICFLLVLLQFPPSFASTSLHRLLSLQKKRNTWFCLRCAGHFCLSNYYLGCRCLVLVAEGFLHGLCVFLGCLTSVFASFCIHKPSSATKLAKKEKHLVLSPLRGAFLSFKLLFRMSLPGARSPGFSSQPLFFLWCLTPVFSSFWIRKPSSATRIAKKKQKKTSGKNPQNNKGLSAMSWRRTLFRGFVFFGGVFLQFFVFGSGSLHRLLRLKNKKYLTKTTKPKDCQHVRTQDFL